MSRRISDSVACRSVTPDRDAQAMTAQLGNARLLTVAG